MSYDRKLDWDCPHMVVEEALFLASNRVSVRPLRPISAADSVKIRVNGERRVGPMGFEVPAQVTSPRLGPFTINQGVNDTLKVRLSDGSPDQEVVLPAGRDFSISQMAEMLAQRVRGVSFTIERQRLHIQTRAQGRAATLVFLSGSTLAPTLGLAQDRQWRGQLPVPGWSLIRDPNTLSDRPTRYIVFDEPLKGYQNYVEINYATLREECRRCGGLGVENDWRYARNGETVNVEDEALLIQEFTKAIYTIKGSNPFALWHGTQILEAVGQKVSNAKLLQQFISADIRDAFQRWREVKKQQEDAVGQFVSDAEFPFSLLQVQLNQSQEDPTIVFVSAVVQSRSAQPIQIDRGVRVPLPADLLGSSAQEGLVRQSLSKFVLNG